MSDPYTVLLYYKYVRIDDPAGFTAEHKAFCERLNLKGRIIIAAEGINGTVAGSPCAVAEYEHAMRENPLFADIEFKRSEGSPDTFPKLSVKCRKEIVSLHLAQDVHPDTALNNHLSPEQWKTMLDEKKNEVVLFDVRNRYESDVGKFQGAIAPAIENFRELPAALAEYEDLKEKTVLMYCTGGIRCEKASALFQREGFKNVFQLHGGIVSYLEKFPKAHWEGDCFVFDQRMLTPIQEETGKTGACAYSGKPTS
ncbi:MAG: hypothetical protein JWM68_1117, partial [Verrucomicrobiales bacterium]|nr:hypothetical protein [Verrucomicrobiales bacterium]